MTETFSTDQKKIIEQITKLLALSKSSNENEAALALAKVEELLEKYRLDMTQIEMMSGKKEEIIEDDEPLFDSEKLSDWESRLAHQVACINGCTTIQFSDFQGIGKIMKIIGRPSDIMFVRYLVSYITLELFRLSVGPLYKKRKDYKDSWFLGAVDVIIMRLKTAKANTQRQFVNQFAVATVNNRQQEAQDKLHELYNDTHEVTDKQKIRENAYHMGRNAGSTIKLTKEDRLTTKSTLQ